jgi:hypothetical protein
MDGLAIIELQPMGGKAMQYFRSGAVRLLGVLCFSLFLPSFVSAQADEDESGVKPSRGAQYYLGQEDELLMRVNIWGFVHKPGQYMVPKDTDLISLISFAGGPLDQAKMNNVKIIRAHQPAIQTNGAYSASNGHATSNELGRSSRNHSVGSNHQSPQVIKVNIKKYLKNGQQVEIPELMPGDTIVVPGSAFQFIGKTLDFASKFAVIAQIYFWVKVAQR